MDYAQQDAATRGLGTCRHCRFWLERDVKNQGECHRRGPVFEYTIDPWPKCDGDDFCGEHEPWPDSKRPWKRETATP